MTTKEISFRSPTISAWPSIRSVDSVYDELNQLTSRTWQGGGIDSARIDFGYNDRGDRTSTERFSDLAASQRIGRSLFDYDASGRSTGITYLDALDAVLADYDYTYDLTNQLIQETRLGDSVDYAYDLLGQLTAADYALQTDEFYNYDANGNRTSSSIPGSNYGTGPNNQLLSDGEFNYEYDAEGNQILKTEISTGNVSEYEYDHRNRLIRVTEMSSGGIILSESSYVYDVAGRRIAQTVDSDGEGPAAAETTYYTYNGNDTWADFDEAGNILARYLYGTEVDEIMARWQTGSGTSWYLTDRLGTVRDLVDATGVLLNQISYDSFGQVLLQTNATAGDRFLFTGRELDAATQQYFYRARYYNANTGRFTQQDPIGFRGLDLNLYRYVGNRPINARDPSGLVTINQALTFLNNLASGGIASTISTLVCDAAERELFVRDPGQPNLLTASITGSVTSGVTGIFLQVSTAIQAGVILGTLLQSVGDLPFPQQERLVFRATCAVASAVISARVFPSFPVPRR